MPPALSPKAEICATLLTGGQDPHYALGLAMALVNNQVSLEVIGSDELDVPGFRSEPKISFLNLRGEPRGGAGLGQKITRVLRYYQRLLLYAANSRPRVFHILWNNRLENFDRTLLLLYYKALGKKLAFTAHNVNLARRDGIDSWFNRLTLRLQYRIVDHIFVHTERMKIDLEQAFKIPEAKVTVIPFGINNAVPDTALTGAEARAQLGVRPEEKVILFFGAIAPYKGLDVLLESLRKIALPGSSYRLVIAGKPKGGCEPYLSRIRQSAVGNFAPGQVVLHTQYIADPEIEVYFKAADVLALPYREIFQSGVLFLGHSFGIPVVASDVGSFRDDIIDGENGFLCRPGDADDLAATLRKYFQSDLFRNLQLRRAAIRERAAARHSWEAVGEITRGVYDGLLGRTL
jgi:glycosyltransferase involved in cell wall biosynthesis